MRIKLDLDDECANRLIESSVAEWRPPSHQADVLLRRALGLPDRRPTSWEEKKNPPATTPAGQKETVECTDLPQLATV